MELTLAQEREIAVTRLTNENAALRAKVKELETHIKLWTETLTAHLAEATERVGWFEKAGGVAMATRIHAVLIHNEELERQLAALTARLTEVEQELEKHFTAAQIMFEEKHDLIGQLATMTAERDRLAAQLASMIQPSHE